MRGLWGLLSLWALLGLAGAFKPVIYMHGLFGSATESSALLDAIRKHHPGTITHSVNQYNDENSLKNMVEQVTNIGQEMTAFMKQHPGGVHIICYSQGGLACRGVLEANEHNVDTFISLSSPQAGQFGDTAYLKYLFPKYLKETIYKLFYTTEGQKLSIADYWNDPHHQDLYRNVSKFLAILNEDTSSPESQKYKANFLRLKKLVLIGGPNDGVITPWQSSHFGFYDENEKIVEMKQRKCYTEDRFGLRTLDERNAIVTHMVPGVQHLHWITNATVISRYILPYLT